MEIKTENCPINIASMHVWIFSVLDTPKEGDTNNDVFGIFFLYEPEFIFIIYSSVVIIALTFIANNTKILVYEMNKQ